MSPAPQPEAVPVFVTNAVATSQGAGPGVRELPPAEAAALVGRKLAVWGTEPPRNWPTHPGMATDRGVRG
jgi:hypothetical protein